MLRSRGGRGIIGTMATTAVVAGTAGAVHHRQEQRYQNKAMEQQYQMQMQQPAYQNPVASAPLQAQPAAAVGNPDMASQLQQLTNMLAAGLLTPEQFESAKNKLLGL